MRWKLANGSVIASTKQPIKHRDFDRLEANYVEYDFSDESIDVSLVLYNPSTHTIRKSINGEVYLSVCPNGRSGCQAIHRHLNYNYYKIQSVRRGWNEITVHSYYFKRDSIRGRIRDGRMYGGKRSMDRLHHPEDYEYDMLPALPTDYITISSNVNFDNVKDNHVTLALWRGPYRKHKKKLTTSIVCDLYDIN